MRARRPTSERTDSTPGECKETDSEAAESVPTRDWRWTSACSSLESAEARGARNPVESARKRTRDNSARWRREGGREKSRERLRGCANAVGAQKDGKESDASTWGEAEAGTSKPGAGADRGGGGGRVGLEAPPLLRTTLRQSHEAKGSVIPRQLEKNARTRESLREFVE